MTLTAEQLRKIERIAGYQKTDRTKSLEQMMSGEPPRFDQNLLATRVDVSVDVPKHQVLLTDFQRNIAEVDLSNKEILVRNAQGATQCVLSLDDTNFSKPIDSAIKSIQAQYVGVAIDASNPLGFKPASDLETALANTKVALKLATVGVPVKGEPGDMPLALCQQPSAKWTR